MEAVEGGDVEDAATLEVGWTPRRVAGRRRVRGAARRAARRGGQRAVPAQSVLAGESTGRRGGLPCGPRPARLVCRVPPTRTRSSRPARPAFRLRPQHGHFAPRRESARAAPRAARANSARCSRPTASTPTIATAPRSGSRSRARSTHATISCMGLRGRRPPRLARLAGFQRAEALAQVEVDGHPESATG